MPGSGKGGLPRLFHLFNDYLMRELAYSIVLLSYYMPTVSPFDHLAARHSSPEVSIPSFSG